LQKTAAFVGTKYSKRLENHDLLIGHSPTYGTHTINIQLFKNLQTQVRVSFKVFIYIIKN